MIDTILNMEDYSKLGDMSKIKRTLKSCMDMDRLVAKSVEIIDSCKSFEFRSVRSKKFIDINDPTFILVCKALDFNKINQNNITEINKLTTQTTDLLNREVISEIGNFITDCVTDTEKFNSLFKNLPEEFASTLLTNIYIIRLSIKDNSVVLKFFI